MAKIRHMVFYSPGEKAGYRITQQIDHTWFLTVFGQENLKRPYKADEFLAFVHKNYDKEATFEIADYGLANDCCATLRFTEMGIANKFLADFTQLLEKLA